MKLTQAAALFFGIALIGVTSSATAQQSPSDIASLSPGPGEDVPTYDVRPIIPADGQITPELEDFGVSVAKANSCVHFVWDGMGTCHGVQGGRIVLSMPMGWMNAGLCSYYEGVAKGLNYIVGCGQQ